MRAYMPRYRVIKMAKLPQFLHRHCDTDINNYHFIPDMAAVNTGIILVKSRDLLLLKEIVKKMYQTHKR